MNSESREFSARLLVFLSAVFVIHMLVNKLMSIPLFQHQILVSYATNTVLAVGIFWGLTSLKKKYNNQIGFLFLASSIVKFLVFFLVFYGPYKADGEIVLLEYISFFIPYTICLVLETFFLSKHLNKT
ncbi:MAG: DUF6168 family protein [Bacteroidota bacterium]|nr:DUF6168 family protein [Bacteroidota bacterium]MEC8323281.1 DUF6168 family protein [Bacteroidota bacterium]